MDAKLKVVGGKANKGTISLKLPTVIGRSRKAGLTIAHPMISRRHCELYEADGLLMIRDFDSLNGTVIAERRIKEAALPPDAEFSIGPLTLRAEYAYKGDLSGLPETVFAEPPAEPAEPQASWSDSPEPIAVDQMTETVPPAEEAEVDFSFLEEFKSDQPAAAEPPTESVEEEPVVDVSPPATPSKPAAPKKKPASMLKGSAKKDKKAAKQPPLPVDEKPAEATGVPLAPEPEAAPAPPKEPPTKPDEEDFDIDSFLDGLN